MSEEHRTALEERGFESVTQECVTGVRLRNAPWKTYWSGNFRGAKAFVKINYGYAAEVNLRTAEKEALLPDWFRGFFRSESILLPTVIDLFEIEGAHAVVFGWIDSRPVSFGELSADPQLAARILRFFEVWGTIPPPEWWTDRHVLADYAFHAKSSASAELAPFGFDLHENFALTADGRLMLFDFEHIQWTTRGVQPIYLALKLLDSRLSLLRAIRGRGTAVKLTQLVGRTGFNEAAAQALLSYEGRLKRGSRSGSARLLALPLLRFWNRIRHQGR